MKIQRMPEDIVPLLNDLVRRLTALETRPLGTVFINESLIIKDPDTGVETIIGDLHGEGEDRHGIKQWVGDTTPPPIPTSPMVSANLGVFSVAWDGANKDGSPQAPDFSHINVYGNDGVSTKLVGALKTKDEVAIVTGAEYNVPWTFWFTSVDFNGNESNKSDDSLQISVTPLVEEVDMKAILDDINERYDGVITEAERLNDVLADAEQTIADTKTSLDELENVKLPQVEANIEAAHQEIVSTGAELGSRLDQAETDINTAEAGLNTLKNTDLPALNQRLSNAETEITTTGAELGSRLTQAETDINTAEAGLDTLKNTELPALKQRLSDAETEITTTGQQLDARLDDAFIQIGTVDAKAVANATAASNAQTAADNASTAAANAAGIAGSKGKVLVQSTAPGVADRNAVTLWIDTTGGANTPKRWTSGTTWVAVTDKAAKDAAQAAVTAQARADSAHTAAGNAQTTANNALTMAGSKNSVFYSTNAPSGTASLGDTWRRVNTKGDVIGEWRWTSGNTWLAQQVTTEMISNLDVGKLTAGTANISDLVVEKLWAEVIRAKKITTDQLLVGQGTNFLADPDFDDPVINELRVGGRNWNAVKNATYGNGFYTNSETTADFPLWNESNGRFSVEPDGVYALTIYANGPDQLQAYLNCFYEDGYTNSGPTIRKFAGINGGAPKKYTVSWDMSTLHSPDGAPVKEVTVNVRRLSTPAGQTNYYNNIYSAWFGRMTDGALIVTGSITADHIESVSVAAELAEFINLDVSQLVASSAKISDLVVEKLWAEVIRAKKITTDQLLVGSGSNLIVDPYFEDETIKAYRHSAASTMQGGWGRNSATNLNWYGGTQSTGASTFYFNTIASRTNKDGMIPIVAGDKFRFNFLYNSIGGGARPIVQVVKTDGTSVISASNFTINGVATSQYGSAGSGQTLEAVWTPPADYAYFIPGIQWETAVTSSHIYGGASVQNMADGSLIVDGSIDADSINTNSIVAEVAKFIELDVSSLIASNATINTAVIEKLWTDVIRSRKITTDQLLVGQGENLVPWDVYSTLPDRTANILGFGGGSTNPGLQGNGGVADGKHLFMVADWVTSGTSTNTWRIMSDPSASPWAFQGFKVEPEEEFQAQIYVKAGGTYTSGMPSVALAGVWYKADGTYIVTHVGDASSLTWSWDKREVSLKAPATAAYLHLYVRQDQPGGVRVDLPSLYRKKGASLIVDGAIEAKHITASESMSAKLGEFLTLNAENFNVTGTGKMSEAVITKLWSDVVMSKKITADMMVVGGTNNVIPNASLTNDTSGWDSGGRNVSNGPNGQPSIWKLGAGNLKSARFDLVSGEEYRFKVQAMAQKAGSRIYIQLVTDSPLSSGHSPYIISNAILTTDWTSYSEVIEIPSGATSGYINVYHNHPNGTSTDGYQWFTGWSLIQMSAGELIVDGSITAKHIHSDAVEARHIKANAVTADKIEAGAIKTSHLAVGTGRELIGNGSGQLKNNTGFEGFRYSARSSSTPLGHPGYFYSTAGQETTTFLTGDNILRVKPNTKYKVSVWLRANSSGSNIYLEPMTGSTSTGSRTDPVYPFNQLEVPTSWTHWTTEFTTGGADAGTMYFRWFLNHSTGTNTNTIFYFTGFSVEEMVEGTIISDGAITTNKIAANTITAEKMTIGVGTNLFPDPLIKDLGAWNNAHGSYSVIANGGRNASGNALRITAASGQTGGYFGAYSEYETRRIPVVPGRSYRITTWIKPSVATTVGANIAMYFRLYPETGVPTNKWTTPSSGTAKYVTDVATISNTVWTKFEVEVMVPSDTDYTFMTPGFYLQSGFPAGAYVDWCDISVTEMSSGELIVDGAIDGKTITGALIQTDKAANKGIKLKNEGLEVYSPGGDKTLSITAGQGVDFIGVWGHENATVNAEDGSISFPTGVEPEQVATITAKGEITGKSLEVDDVSIPNTLAFSGEPMDGHGSGNHGPTIMGRDLLGATYTEFFNDNHGESKSGWLTPMPHGLLSNSYHNGWSGASGNSWTVEGNPGKVQVLTHLRDTVEIKNGRGYLITYTTPAFKTTDGKSGSPGAAVVKYTTGRTLGVDAGTALHGSRYYISGSADFDNPGRTVYAVGGQDLPAGDVTLGVEVYVYDGRKIQSTTTADARYWSINVLDVGSAVKGNTGNTSSITKKVPAAPSSPPVVDPPPKPKPPVKKTYTKTWNASWWATYWVGNGDGINSGMKSPKVAQGKPPGVSYRQRGAIGFPNMLGANDLNGVELKDLKKVEVYVYASHWYSSGGGTLEIGTHGHTSKPSKMTEDLVSNRKSQALKKPEGRWVTLPSSVHAGVLSGSVRGIQAYTSSTSLSKYGYLDGKKSKIRVTYVK